jgi:hypothetical protein
MQAIQPTPDCLAVERLDASDLTTAERDHLATCARCQTELALWREFEASTPDASETAAIAGIVAGLRRQRDGKPRMVWMRGVMAAAAALIVGLGLVYVTRDRGPVPLDVKIDGPQTYRSRRIEAISPTGDLAAAPRELSWQPVEGAVRYDVVLREVDQSIVWRATSAVPHVALPPDVLARIVHTKPFLWEVDARDQAGASIGTTGTLRFRVTGTSSGGG